MSDTLRPLHPTAHIIRPADAPRIARWLAERGGIAVWSSANLSNPSGSWTTPRRQADGTPTPKPTWQAQDEPEIITDARDVLVEESREVARFRVAVRVAGQLGQKLELTDASTRRVRAKIARLNARREPGQEGWYAFDYATQQAVFYVPTSRVALSDWAHLHATCEVV